MIKSHLTGLSTLLLFLLFSHTSFSIEGFYKDLFIDGGVGLTNRTSLAAADHLKLTQEFLATSDTAIQSDMIIGNSIDDNGVLLYPDGEPRFCSIQINGGGATSHGSSLGSSGRGRIQTFHSSGGSYTGTCAGAFIACMGYEGNDSRNYLHLWPSWAHKTFLTDAYTGQFIPAESPILNYYTYGDDLYIADVRHNGGCYADENDVGYWNSKSEILLRYDNPGHNIHNKISCWAYKHSAQSGRLVVIGSHPEGVSDGEQRDLMAAMLQYTRAGLGDTTLKATLQNGVTRNMNSNNTPGYENIGDKQYHHFKINVPPGVAQIEIMLDGDDNYDLDLYLFKGDFAFRDQPGIIKAGNDTSADEVINLPDPEQGEWYIGIKCYTTVDATWQSWGYEYSGKTGVLNGVAYTITASWQEQEQSMWRVY